MKFVLDEFVGFHCGGLVSEFGAEFTESGGRFQAVFGGKDEE